MYTHSSLPYAWLTPLGRDRHADKGTTLERPHGRKHTGALSCPRGMQHCLRGARQAPMSLLHALLISTCHAVLRVPSAQRAVRRTVTERNVSACLSLFPHQSK